MAKLADFERDRRRASERRRLTARFPFRLPVLAKALLILSLFLSGIVPRALPLRPPPASPRAHKGRDRTSQPCRHETIGRLIEALSLGPAIVALFASPPCR